MLERFTVDLIADDVASRLRAGAPTNRLLHRFFRKGRWDGRRAHDPLSLALLLRESVNLASTDLCTEYLAQCRETLLELARCNSRTGLAPSRLPESEPPTFPVAVDRLAPEEPPLPASPAHVSDGDTMLREALIRRRALSARRRTRKLEIDAEVKAKAIRREHDEARRLVEEAEHRREELLEMLHQLKAEYLERFNAIAYFGSLLWARYCNGYEQGYSARRSRGSTVRPPRNGLAFDVPSVLTDVDPQAVGIQKVVDTGPERGMN